MPTQEEELARLRSELDQAHRQLRGLRSGTRCDALAKAVQKFISTRYPDDECTQGFTYIGMEQALDDYMEGEGYA